MGNQQTFSGCFGELLKTYRKRQRLTQRLLAQQLGVHINTVSSWELGTYLPATRGLVLELARHLVLNESETRQLLEANLTASSPYFLVPWPRNPFFTGREEILEALHAQLGIDQTVALTQSSALHGLGGVGKTQLALEYAYRHALEYSAVFWISAETEEQIVTSLLRVADMLQLPERENKDQHRVIAAVQRWLISHSQWLLIWDNVEDPALLHHFLPSTRAGAILLTTRSSALGTLARSLHLVPMEQEEGILFLLRRAKVLSPEATGEQVQQLVMEMSPPYAAADLVRAMGGLPLALDQAGAYIEETQCSLPAYVDLFHTRRADLLQQRGEGSREHPESVLTTFRLSITATAGHHPAVWDLLRVCALLSADTIPEELFRQGARHLGAKLQAACRDELEWNRLIAVACSYSLVQRHPEERTLSIHRLVQAVLLEAMTQAEQEQWNKRLIEALDMVFPEVQPATKYDIWKQGERLLPHTLLCLRRAEAASESLALASLAYKVAQYLRERGQYPQAEPFFLQAVHMREHIFGRDHAEVASPVNYLGVLYWEQGRYARAEPLLQQALSIWERSLGSDHPLVARALTNLANLSGIQRKYREAEPLLQRALQIREKALGPDQPQVATSLNNLANVYLEQGKYLQAEPIYQRAFRIYEQTLGPDHPLTAFSLANLADLYHKMGKDREAEPLCQRALSLREQALGPDHPLVAMSLNNLAEIYTQWGKYTEAEALYQRALSIREQALGSDHPFVALSLAALASLFYERGDSPRAKILFERAIQMSEQSQGPDHPDVATSLSGLANISRDQDRYAEAERLYLQALSILEHHLGQHHPDTAQTLHDLALLRKSQGKRSEARSLAEHALSIRSQLLGDAHPKTVATRALCAQLGQVHARAEEARAVSRQETEQLPIHTRSVAVRGATEQIAYIRTIRMREVTFTCTICGQIVTQLHYPSGRIKYCSEACRAVKAAQVQEERVARQREKRRIKREAQTAPLPVEP